MIFGFPFRRPVPTRRRRITLRVESLDGRILPSGGKVGGGVEWVYGAAVTAPATPPPGEVSVANRPVGTGVEV